MIIIFHCINNIFYDKIFYYRNFNLLSFGEEAEEDEEESVILNKKFSNKGKSAHDHLTDPKLSAEPAIEPTGPPNKKKKEDRSSDWESDEEMKTQEEMEIIKKEKELSFIYAIIVFYIMFYITYGLY